MPFVIGLFFLRDEPAVLLGLKTAQWLGPGVAVLASVVFIVGRRKGASHPLTLVPLGGTQAMTAHAHDSSTHQTHGVGGAAPGPRAARSRRPRWLLPAVVGGSAVAILVVYGVVPPSAVLYGGFFGGMLLMHLGGHGHGGHGGDDDGTPTSSENPSRPSADSAPARTGRASGRTERGPSTPVPAAQRRGSA